MYWESERLLYRPVMMSDVQALFRIYGDVRTHAFNQGVHTGTSSIAVALSFSEPQTVNVMVLTTGLSLKRRIQKGSLALDACLSASSIVDKRIIWDTGLNRNHGGKVMQLNSPVAL